MNKKATAGFSLTGNISRSEFGIGTKFPDQMVSDIVRIKADVEFTHNNNCGHRKGQSWKEKIL